VVIEILDWKSRILDLFFRQIQCQGKRQDQDLSCKGNYLVLAENKSTRKNGHSMSSEMALGQVSEELICFYLYVDI